MKSCIAHRPPDDGSPAAGIGASAGSITPMGSLPATPIGLRRSVVLPQGYGV